MTAKAGGLELDKLSVSTDVTKKVGHLYEPSPSIVHENKAIHHLMAVKSLLRAAGETCIAIGVTRVFSVIILRGDETLRNTAEVSVPSTVFVRLQSR